MSLGYFSGCAGLEGLLTFLSGVPHPLFSWPGNKFPWAATIAEEARLPKRLPSRIWLNEPDQKVRFWLTCMLNPGVLRRASAELRQYRNEGLHELFLELRDQRFDDPARELARWAFVAGNSYKGRARDWKTTSGRGEANLRPPGLVKRFEAFASVTWPVTRITGRSVLEIDPKEVAAWFGPVDRKVFSFDPPYAGTTGYKTGTMQLEDSLRVAHSFYDADFEVLFHEGQDLSDELTDWKVVDLLLTKRKGQSLQNFRRHGTGEFLHLSPKNR